MGWHLAKEIVLERNDEHLYDHNDVNPGGQFFKLLSYVGKMGRRSDYGCM